MKGVATTGVLAGVQNTRWAVMCGKVQGVGGSTPHRMWMPMNGVATQPGHRQGLQNTRWAVMWQGVGSVGFMWKPVTGVAITVPLIGFCPINIKAQGSQPHMIESPCKL